jgi:medium-chain acyl-[acyl-carrier-protein] hydrolase
LVEPPHKTAKLKLYCFPPAGGGAATYRLWAASLGPDVGVYRLQPPGREDRFREPFFASIEEYVEPLAAHNAADDAPIAQFGHSMGSIAAFETARAVRRAAQKEPRRLIVSAFQAPDAPRAPDIHTLPDAEFIEAVRTRYGGIPDQLLSHPEVLELMLPIVRADLAMLNRYRYTPSPPLGCAITAVGGRSDTWVDEAGLAEWRRMTAGGFDLHLLPGGHFYLHSALPELLAIVRRALPE